MIENFTYDRNINDYSLYKNLMLIDAKISDAELFYNSANSDTFAILYNDISSNVFYEEYDKDNIVTQKNELVKLLENNFINLKRISIVSDDTYIGILKPFLDSKPYFKIDELESTDINNYSENLIFMIELIKKFNITNLDYLMCNSLQYDNWVKYFDIIKLNTGVVIGASTDQTGNIEVGGDWIMESTNEDIKPIYFSDTILTYKNTLATTISTSVTLTQALVNSYVWPVTIQGGTIANPVTITVGENLTLTSSTRYFIIGSNYIVFNGNNYNITYQVGSIYNGLIQNGTSSTFAFSNITIKNINFKNSGGSISNGGGWIAQSYFGNGSTYATSNILIDNCNSDSTITANGGGICGSYLNYGCANLLTVSNCYSTGTISSTAGGICGSYSNYCLITKCYSTGIISGSDSGGICGKFAGSYSSLKGVTISNCYSIGNITGTNAGGICGSYAGSYDNINSITGRCVITDCYSTGNITGISAGGILGAYAGYGEGAPVVCNVSNSFSLGTIGGQYSGGICGRYCGYGGSCTLSKCYSVGSISASDTGGLIGSNASNVWTDPTDPLFTANGTCTVNNCYSRGNQTGTNSGGLVGSNSSKTSCNNSYVAGNIFGPIYDPNIVDNNTDIGINIYNYFGYGTWLTSNAKNNLTSTTIPTYSGNVLINPFGSIWTDTSFGTGSNSPYIFTTLGTFTSPYITSSATLNPGQTSQTANVTSGVTYYIIAINNLNPSFYSYISINATNGAISASASTVVGVYSISVYQLYTTGLYNLSTFTLTVTITGSLSSIRGQISSIGSNTVYTANLTVNGTSANSVVGLYPTGTILLFGSITPPTGWLICNGATISTVDFNDLFGIIGYTFGGSGTSFQLPNFTSLLPRGKSTSLGNTGGSNTITLTQNNLPAHSHKVNAANVNGSHTHAIDWTNLVDGTATSVVYKFQDTSNSGLGGNRRFYDGFGQETLATMFGASNEANKTGIITAPSVAFSGNTSAKGLGTVIDITNPYINMCYIIKY